MKSVVAFLLAMALPLASVPGAAEAASTVKYSEATLCQILEPCEPPAQYASGPFLAPPVIRDVSLDEIQSVCGSGYKALLGSRAAAVPSIMGCASFQAGSCIVHVPADIKTMIPELYAVVLRHELAHCRGWVHADYDTASLP